MRVNTLPKTGNGGTSGGSGGSGGSTSIGQLVFSTSIAGAQGKSLPGNIKIIGIEVKCNQAKVNVSCSIVGNADINLLFGPFDFVANESKSIASNVYLPVAAEISTTNTDLVGGLFTFCITYILLPASFI